MQTAADEDFAIFEKFVRPKRTEMRDEDAEMRSIRAGMIRARMHAQQPTYDQMEAYASARHCFSSDHVCDSDPRRWCWTNLERGAMLVDPATAAPHIATGRVYVCRVSGRVHVCDGADCYRYSRIEPDGSVVCWVSGINLGSNIVAAPSTANRKQINDANVATVAPTTKRGGTHAKAPPAKRVYRNTNTGKRFAQGSIADEMQRTRPEERVQYGGGLVRFAITLVSDDSRKTALGWSHFLTYTAPRTTWKTFLSSAYTKADAMAQRFTNIVVNSGRIDPIGFRSAIFAIFEAHFSDQVGHAEWLAFSSEYNGRAEAYFAEAMIALWKITESTPLCCEQQAFPGGPTRKKQRTRSHLRSVACGLIYMLAKGYNEKVRYDRQTRVLLNEAEVARTDPDRIVTERVVFIPPNRYLATCLPSPKHLNSGSLSFESVICGMSSLRTITGANERQAAAEFGPDLLSNMGWVNEGLRSLANVRPALTIDKLREYQLCNYVTLHDVCPLTGKFLPIKP